MNIMTVLIKCKGAKAKILDVYSAISDYFTYIRTWGNIKTGICKSRKSVQLKTKFNTELRCAG